MKSNKEAIIAIPKNTRLREEVEPILKQGLALTQSEPGILRSRYVDDTIFVEMKICDMVQCLRSRMISLALISDAKGLEERATLTNYTDRLLKPDEKSRKMTDGKIERIMGLRIENPAVLRALVREEDREKMSERLYRQPNMEIPLYEKGVSTYPQLMEYYFRRRFGKNISQSDICLLNGQVESFMRNGVIPNVNLAYDIVGSGATARRFGLVPIDTEGTKGDKAYRVYPSFWRKENLYPYEQDAVDRIIPEIKRIIGELVPLDERNAALTLGGY